MNTITTIPRCNITIPKNWQYQTGGSQEVIITPQSSKAYIRIDTNLDDKFKNSRITERVTSLKLETFEAPGDKGVRQIDISKSNKGGKDILLVRRYTRSEKDTLNVDISEQEKLTASRKVPKRKVRGAEKPSKQPPTEEPVPRPYSYDL